MRASGRNLYSIDDIGSAFDEHTVISSEVSEWLNSKDDLATISAYAPNEIIKSMYAVTLKDYRIQPELTGQNRNFQVFLDPERPDCIQVVALTDQLVEDDGKTYKSSVNYPITSETVATIGPVIVDMVKRIRARAPDAFGFLMCDFFQDGDKITIYDPGIRPTGNTATAMVLHFTAMLTGRDLYVQNFHIDTRTPGYQFGEFCTRMGSLVELDNIAREHRGVLLWGWNHVTGFGALVGVAPDKEAWQAMVDYIRTAYTKTHNIRTA